MHLFDLLVEWERDAVSRGLDRERVAADRLILLDLAGHTMKSLLDIRPSDVSEFLTWIADTSVSVPSAMEALARFYAWATAERGYLSGNPVTGSNPGRAA
jgi:hypothetical protein